MTLKPLQLLSFAFCLLLAVGSFCRADTVIMKDGTVYKGKILIDTDKALLIGNPPFDPNSYMLESKDIAKIIYEQYHPNPPAERKRGLAAEARLTGDIFSSKQLSLGAAPGLYAGLGFRVHPFFELDGGMNWNPGLHSGSGLSVSNGTGAAGSRQYNDFYGYSGEVSGRFYSFFRKKWKTEPYFTTGYDWSHLIPKDSGDQLSGSGWIFGVGAIRPLTTHLFLEARLLYQSLNFDTIDFLGQEGEINPTITEHKVVLSAGVSYRL